MIHARRVAPAALACALLFLLANCRVVQDLGENPPHPDAMAEPDGQADGEGDGATLFSDAASRDLTAPADSDLLSLEDGAAGDGPLSCAPGRTYCANAQECVDLTTNTRHCGDCAVGCAISQEVCIDSVCVKCVGGDNCGGVCVHTKIDRNNCGACGVQCLANQSCVAGICQ